MLAFLGFLSALQIRSDDCKADTLAIEMTAVLGHLVGVNVGNFSAARNAGLAACNGECFF